MYVKEKRPKMEEWWRKTNELLVHEKVFKLTSVKKKKVNQNEIHSDPRISIQILMVLIITNLFVTFFVV
jgi:hypothetical protein